MTRRQLQVPVIPPTSDTFDTEAKATKAHRINQTLIPGSFWAEKSLSSDQLEGPRSHYCRARAMHQSRQACLRNSVPNVRVMKPYSAFSCVWGTASGITHLGTYPALRPPKPSIWVSPVEQLSAGVQLVLLLVA
jgi:hypothetical protein